MANKHIREATKMIRLIDANAFIEKYCEGCGGHCDWDDMYCATVDDLMKAPTVEAVEVVHGRWVLVEYQSSPFGVDREYQCSICGTPTDDEDYRTRYCPNCGARMDGDGNG